MQILGTPVLLDAFNQVIRDSLGDPIPGSVFLTSIHDKEIGKDTNPDAFAPTAAPGDWGGIVFRRDIDQQDVNRFDYDRQGDRGDARRLFFQMAAQVGDILGIGAKDPWTQRQNRADRLQIWKEPFVQLRAPDLYNLRRDPFEKAKIGANTYEDWYIDRAYLLGPMQVVASKFLLTLKEYPPSPTPGDWSLKSLEEQIKAMNVGGN